ncbi:tRNA guanosine(34) transglycosylase Tgt [Candidatus Poriferisodalis sp.]|uniref:tRNA guanosine(34) transglycosylase Tgt n=1 Tax=Candidatus Poriferisodalis sp. TaxID=3101277 RepID=UPI003B01B69C
MSEGARPTVPAARFELLASDGAARRGQVTTARGTFQTPVFMPVGTRGAVIHLDAGDYESLGLEIVLANTYHLMLRPGVDTVAALGGLEGFTGWGGHFLTDSGGFQVMSLGRRPGSGAAPSGGLAKSRVDDEGVTFRSVYDGSKVRLTPEDAVDAQRRLASDIQMALDVCPELPAPPEDVRLAMERTHAWAARAKAAMEAARSDAVAMEAARSDAVAMEAARSDAVAMEAARSDATLGGQALFGIVQGGSDPQMRRHSAQTLAGIGFDGYGIGGLSVGETRTEMEPALRAATDVLPTDRPRYLMGVGDPARITDAIAVGVDMFDCVLPSRLARHGTALTPNGRINIRNARFARDDTPLDLAPERPGGRFSRGYLRHLMSVNEPTAARILTLHNIAYVVGLVAEARAAITAGSFETFRRQVNEVWS